MDIALILNRHYPDKRWTLSDNDYGNLYWASGQGAMPTETELQAKWDEWTAGALARKKQEARDKVNAEAGALRLRYVTDAPLQSLVYQRKGEEARAYKSVKDAGGTPVVSDYPHIEAEIGVRGASADEVVALFLTNDALWASLSAQIEGIRQAAMVAIEAATDEAGVDAAAGIDWSGVGQ